MNEAATQSIRVTDRIDPAFSPNELGTPPSPDPLTVHGLGSDLNPYAYVRGRPTSAVDPLGLSDTTDDDDEELGGELVFQWFDSLAQNYVFSPLSIDVTATTSPYDPWANANAVDRWLNTSDAWFANIFRDDQLLANMQNGAASVALAAATIATGGLALEAAGISSLTGAIASVNVWFGNAAQAFTAMALAEQGIVVGAGGGGALYLGEQALDTGAARMEMQALDAAGESFAQAGSRGFGSFSSFKRAMGSAGDDMQWHHIVEQTPGNLAKFGAQAIHHTDNLVRLDTGLHRQVSALYSSIRPDITGSTSLTVRQWLSTQSFDAQTDFGQRVIQNITNGVWP